MNSQFQLFKQDNQQSGNQTSVLKKVQGFKNSIRRREVQDHRNSIREALLNSLSGSFQTLKSIQINKTLFELSRINVSRVKEEISTIEILANDLFLYSRSKQEYHLFELIEPENIEKLIQLVQWSNVAHYQCRPRIYIQIFSILACYTLQSKEIHINFIELLRDILVYLRGLKQWHEDRQKFLYFSQPQLKQIVELVFISLANIGLQENENINIFIDPEGLLAISLEEAKKTMSYLQKHEINENKKQNHILKVIIQFFQRVLEFYTENESLKEKVFKYGFEIVELLLSFIKIGSQISQEIENTIFLSFKTFFYMHLQDTPKILISHDFSIFFLRMKEISQFFCSLHLKIVNFDKQLQIQGQKRDSYQSTVKKRSETQNNLLKILQVIDLIFGVNIPDDKDEDAFYDRFEQWVELYILPTFFYLFSLNQCNIDKVLIMSVGIIKNICLEETLLEQVLGEMLIVKKIVYYASSSHSSYKLRKNALYCLANMMIVTFDGSSDLAEEVLKIILNNQVISTFAQYVGAFVDVEFNITMLKALRLLLQRDSSEVKQENQFWVKFCEEGGQVNLERIINFGSLKESKELDILAESILNQYCGNDI